LQSITLPVAVVDFIAHFLSFSAAITLQFYSDSACTIKFGPPKTNSPPINYCFATDVDDDGYISSTGGWDSNMYTCTTGYPTDTLPAASATRK
jgi:hypothetical protein